MSIELLFSEKEIETLTSIVFSRIMSGATVHLDKGSFSYSDLFGKYIPMCFSDKRVAFSDKRLYDIAVQLVELRDTSNERMADMANEISRYRKTSLT